MQISRVDAQRALLTALRIRMREALCLPVGSPGRSSVGSANPEAQQGSAVVEFTFLALLLMVPVVYFVVTVGQIQGGSFAVVGAADQAAKVFVTQADPASARIAAERSVLVALKDYGYLPESTSVTIECDRAGCSSAGTTVTVTVRLDVSLPLMPFGDSLHLKASRLSASASQVVGRYR
jgi:Flp pilus assembly protein TadG